MIAGLLFGAFTLVSPTDPKILYVGRFDTSDPAVAACQWPASEVRLKVDGKSLIARMDEKGDDRWQVVVDGWPSNVLTLSAGTNSYTIDLGTEAVHDVRLVKRTEAYVGTTKFLGFDTPGGKLLEPKPSDRHLEVVGDSITCGYGNEGGSQTEHFKPATENAYESYASIAARAVGADVTIIAWSGRKMYPDNTMPDIYDLILPTQPQPVYDFKGPAPQAVVINLATNDFGRGNPDEAKWTGAYEAFIKRIWTHYPKAQVYTAVGSMMSDDYPQGQRALTTVRTYLHDMLGRMNDSRLHYLEFDPQKMEDGIGADWHPSVKTQEKMGARLAETLKKDLGW